MKARIKIRQHDRVDCAAACLSSICSYYGADLPLIEVRERCGTSSSEGTNLKGILDAAHQLGLNAKALKEKGKDLSALSGIQEPSILHLQRTDGWLHFIVLYEYGEKKCRIMDPEEGKVSKIDTQALKEQWSGYVILLSPGAGFRKESRRESTFSRYLRLFLTNRKEILYSLAGAIVYIISSLSISLFLQQIVDHILPEKDFGLLQLFALAMLALTLCSGITNYIRSLFTISAGMHIDAQLIMSYIHKLLSLPVAFFSGRSSGELNARIQDVYRIRAFVSGELVILFISIFSLILSFCLLFTYYWKLALTAMAFIPLYFLIYRISDKINRKRNRAMIEDSAKFQDKNIETLEMMRSIRYTGAEDFFSQRLEKSYVSMAKSICKGAHSSALFSALGDMTTLLLTFTVIILGSTYVIENELSTGELVSFFTIISFFTTPMITLIESNDAMSEADIAASRLFEIIDLDSESAREFIPSSQNLSIFDITLKNIAFSYPGQMSLFSDFNCIIKKRMLNMIKGKNGSGKSTLASFLMQGLQPEKGKIFLGEQDIRQIPLEQWRHFVGIVPQQIDIFNSSILENITLESGQQDLDKIISICQRLGLWEKIKALPEGLLSQVGPGGARLSGGEKQKISLARALYRDPQLLILDEATSALDAGSRTEFKNVIRRLLQEGLTLVLITHDDYFCDIEHHMIQL